MIEYTILKHLQNDIPLCAGLAVYDDKPAIFIREAPPETDLLWGGDQYPHIIFSIDMLEDREKETDGVLNLRIMYESGDNSSGEMEKRLRQLIDGYFFSSSEYTLSALWTWTNSFISSQNEMSGIAVSFGLLTYPVLRTDDPDPIRLLGDYLKDKYPEAYIIGEKEDDRGAWYPTDEEATIYIRTVSVSPCNYIDDNYACIWRTAAMKVHVFADDSALRICDEIAKDLSMKKRLIFPDKGPFTIDDTKIDAGTDVHRTGQLSVNGTYGILRNAGCTESIENIYVK